jgi:lysozyme
MLDSAPERLPGSRIKHLGQEGFQWLIDLECGPRGPRVKAYRDSRGIPTIGVGQTVILKNGKWRRVEMTDCFADVDEAKSAFSHLVKLYEAEVDADCRDDITQQTFDSLTSFCFNVGISGFRNSTAVRYLNQMMPVDQIADAMKWWNKPAEVMGRRACEAHLLVHGVYLLQGQAA